MADKAYVEVADIGVKEAFDKKYKATMSKLMTTLLDKAVDRSSKLTTKPPADKSATGFYLDGSLSLKRSAKGVDGEIKMQLADWPKKSIFGVASSKASTDVRNPAKIDDDVEAVVEGLMDDIKAKVIKEFEKRAP